MSTKNKNSRPHFAWLVVAALLIVVYGFALLYVKSKVEKATYAFNNAEISYEQKDKIQATVDSIKDIEIQLQKVNSYFVGSDDIVGFINLLEQNAVEQSVFIETKNVSIQEEVENVRYGEVLEVSLVVSGDWNNVMRYVRLTEALPYNIWITTAKISLEENKNVEIEAEDRPVFNWEANIILQVLKHNSL